jgi:predicted site-specific integrase-resolvase
MRLKEYAEQEGIGYQVAWNRFKAGKIPGAYKNEYGIFIEDEYIVIYAHSRDEFKSLTAFCSDNGWAVSERVKEGSFGFDKLESVVDFASRLVISSRDSLPTYDLISHLLSKIGCKIEIMDEN